MGRGKDRVVRKTRSDKHRPDDVVLCRQCGLSSLRGSLSVRGLCRVCSVQNMLDSVQQMQRKQGPIYELWVNRREAGLKATRALKQGNGDNGPEKIDRR